MGVDQSRPRLSKRDYMANGANPLSASNIDPACEIDRARAVFSKQKYGLTSNARPRFSVGAQFVAPGPG